MPAECKGRRPRRQRLNFGVSVAERFWCLLVPPHRSVSDPIKNHKFCGKRQAPEMPAPERWPTIHQWIFGKSKCNTRPKIVMPMDTAAIGNRI